MKILRSFTITCYNDKCRCIRINCETQDPIIFILHSVCELKLRKKCTFA